MKRAVAAGALVAILALAGTAGTAQAATPTEKKLQRQVATMQRQIATLQKDVKALKAQTKELDEFDGAVLAVAFCVAAASADGLQSTWAVLDQKAGGTTVGPQQAVNDAGACNALQVARSQAVPPSLAPFHGIMRLLAFASIFGGAETFALSARD
jgi:hypothetical protein